MRFARVGTIGLLSSALVNMPGVGKATPMVPIAFQAPVQTKLTPPKIFSLTPPKHSWQYDRPPLVVSHNRDTRLIRRLVTSGQKGTCTFLTESSLPPYEYHLSVPIKSN